jgi:hypothetical protein
MPLRTRQIPFSNRNMVVSFVSYSSPCETPPHRFHLPTSASELTSRYPTPLPATHPLGSFQAQT